MRTVKSCSWSTLIGMSGNHINFSLTYSLNDKSDGPLKRQHAAKGTSREVFSFEDTQVFTQNTDETAQKSGVHMFALKIRTLYDTGTWDDGSPLQRTFLPALCKLWLLTRSHCTQRHPQFTRPSSTPQRQPPPPASPY